MLGAIEAITTSQVWQLLLLFIPAAFIICTAFAVQGEKPGLMWPMIVFTVHYFNLSTPTVL